MTRPPETQEPKPYRIFLSSPVDVAPERDAVGRVIDRIAAELGDDHPIELIRWEDDFYTATSTFQDQIVRPSECDIVVCVFWKRLGSDLPDQYRRPDGSLPTGTEYEFEDAVQHAAQSPDKLPDVLVYRKTAEVRFSEENLELEKAQRDRFLAFWRRWFRNEKGQFVAGFHSFDDTHTFETMVEGHIRRWLRDRSGSVVWARGSPFRGLKHFDVEHAPIFFGRRRETERARARFLANALAGIRFLLIVGPSGCGKSSLVRAGLIPRLAPTGGLDGVPRLTRRAIVTPALLVHGEQANWALGLSQALFAAEALGPELAQGDFNTPERLAALIGRGGPEAAAPVSRALDRASGDLAGATGLIVVVDQLEEIFAWPLTAAESFVACLAALTSSAPVFVIATMRSEFQHRLDDVESLAKLAAVREVRGPDEPERVLNLGVPEAADIREMIAGPARAAGLTFAGAEHDLPDLQTRIERDSTPETLPALQYLLTELYERREGNLLTHAAYDALGGVTGVLTARGEAILADLGSEADVAFVNLARSFIRTGSQNAPAVARRIRTDLFSAESAEGRLAAALRDAGLLVSDQNTLRIAHESLITSWHRVRAVVEKEQRLFDTCERVTSAYRRYQDIATTDHAARRKHLLQGLPLEEARELLAQWGPGLLSDPYPGLPDFITDSDRADRKRRIWRVAGASAVSAVLAAVILIAIWFRSQSQEAARSAQIRLELARAEAALRAQGWDRALDSAIVARNIADTFETRSMALTALMEHSSPHLSQRLSGPAIAARFNVEGRLATISRSGLLDLPSGSARRRVQLTEPDAPGVAYFDFALLPDGGLLVLLSDGRIGLVDAKTLGSSSRSAQPEWISDRGLVLAASSADIHVADNTVQIALGNLSLTPGRLVTCTLRNVRDCRSTNLPAGLRALAFSPHGKQLAIADDQWVKIIDVAAPNVESAPQFTDLENGSVRSLSWVADGSILVVGTDQGDLISTAYTQSSIKATSRKKLSSLPIAMQKGAPSGNQLVSACDDLLCLLSLDSQQGDQGHARLYNIPHGILRLAWSADSRRFVSVHADGQLRVWDSAPQHAILADLPATSGSLTALAVDRQDGTLAAGDSDGRIWFWPPRSGRRTPSSMGGASDAVNHLAFSSRGILAAAFANGDVARIPKQPQTQIARIATNSIVQRVGWLADGTTLVATTPTQVILVDQQGNLSPQSVSALKPNQTLGGFTRLPDRPGLIISVSDGTFLRWEPEKPAEPLLPTADSNDTLSALSLAVHPSGRWLTATRADDQLRVYDLSGATPPLILPLTTRNSTTVAFSPDGAFLAALMSDGLVNVWRFDAREGRIEPLVTVPAVPTIWQSGQGRGSNQAPWIDWIENTHLAIATRGGTVLILSFDRDRWGARLKALTLDSSGPAWP